MPEQPSDGMFTLELRLKVARCREALERSDLNEVGDIAIACAELFAIQEKDLPLNLRYDLVRAREALFGNALTVDGDAEIADDQFRKALTTFSQLERMQFTQALFTFCDRFEEHC